MKISSNILNKILATIFTLIAIVALAMPFIDVDVPLYGIDISGFECLERFINEINNITHWSLQKVCFLFSIICTAFTFLFSLLSFKSRGIGTITFSILGIALMLFVINKIGFDYAGIGIYVYIVALFFAFIFSIFGSVTCHQKGSD